MTAQVITAFGFGLGFVIALLLLAIFFPKPTPFQYNVFRIILSLAAAGVAATIPGFIDLNLSAGTQLAIRAGGALAVFVMVYFFNPAQLAVQSGPAPDAFSFSVPEGWTFQQTVEALVKTDNSVANFIGFNPDELGAPLRAGRVERETVAEALRALRSLAMSNAVRDYDVEFESPAYSLRIRT